MKKSLSIIVPIYNEAENIPELCRHFSRIVKEDFGDMDVTLVCVDDGSNDHSINMLRKYQKENAHLKFIQLSRNFGQHVAIKAGIDYVKSDYTAIMDADLQDDPGNLREMYEILAKGEYDIVLGVRENRGDAWFKRFTSHVFFKVMNYISHIEMQQNQAMLRIFTKEVTDALKNINEIHQNNGAFIAWLGFKQGRLTIPHHKRTGGRTKYDFYKSARFAIETIMNFSNRPLVYISGFGIFISLLSIVSIAAIVYKKIFYDIGIDGWASIITAISFFGGLILFALGVIGLYVGKLYQQSLHRPMYVIKKTFD